MWFTKWFDDYEKVICNGLDSQQISVKSITVIWDSGSPCSTILNVDKRREKQDYLGRKLQTMRLSVCLSV